MINTLQQELEERISKCDLDTFIEMVKNNTPKDTLQKEFNRSLTLGFFLYMLKDEQRAFSMLSKDYLCSINMHLIDTTKARIKYYSEKISTLKMDNSKFQNSLGDEFQISLYILFMNYKRFEEENKV